MLASFNEIDLSFVYAEVRICTLFVGTSPFIVVLNALFSSQPKKTCGFLLLLHLLDSQGKTSSSSSSQTTGGRKQKCPRLNEGTLHGSIVTTIISRVLDQVHLGLAQPLVTVTDFLADRPFRSMSSACAKSCVSTKLRVHETGDRLAPHCPHWAWREERRGAGFSVSAQ
jgi:hypothetical protein